MSDIDNELPQQDAGIAMILQRLKDAKAHAHEKDESPNTDEESTEASAEANAEQSLVASEPEIQVASLPSQVIDRRDDPQVPERIAEEDLSEESLLPWFLKSDKDVKMLHYITFDDSGNLVYNAIKTDRPANDLASLKLRDNYACDIDYYKSRHFVLCVKQFESDYSYSRSFAKLDECRQTISEADDSKPVLARVPTEDVSNLVANADKYWHYVVFTDLGVADFIVRQDDIAYPYGESNLSKWFEEISNHTVLKNTEYKPNTRDISDEAESIREFKYDIITMHMPGVITLDSVDNEDPSYQVHIRLKDEYSFIPLKKLLKCLRYYASHDEKSFDEFRRFINQYFDVVV